MKVENSNNDFTRAPGVGRRMGGILAVIAFIGLIYGASRLWYGVDDTASVLQPEAGESVTIPVEGMSCSACVARVKTTLKMIEGVNEIRVSLANRETEIRYQSEKTSPEKLAEAIEKLGYKVGAPKSKETVR